MPVGWGNNVFQWGWVMGFLQRAFSAACACVLILPTGSALGQSNQTLQQRLDALVQIIKQRGQPTGNGRYTCVQPAEHGSDTIVIDTDGSGVTQEVTRVLSPTNTNQQYGTAVTVKPNPTEGGVTSIVTTVFSVGFPTEDQNRIQPFLAVEKTSLQRMPLSELLGILESSVDTACPTKDTQPAVAGIFPLYTWSM